MIRLEIVEVVEPVSKHANRFRLVEVVQTVDGARTRFTNQSFPTLGEAQDTLNRLTEAYKGRV